METEELASLPEHYERHLGKITKGWSDQKQAHGVQIVCFEKQPVRGVNTYATLGLSRHDLALSSSRRVRQELLLSADEQFLPDAVAALVLSLAEYVLQRSSALLRGEVIGPGGPVIAGSTLTAIYVTNPSPFDTSLTEFPCESPAVVFAYLVPIFNAEATLIREKGWRWFEEELEQQDPNIWDLTRMEQVR